MDTDTDTDTDTDIDMDVAVDDADAEEPRGYALRCVSNLQHWVPPSPRMA